jgi:hypothetical protein
MTAALALLNGIFLTPVGFSSLSLSSSLTLIGLERVWGRKASQTVGRQRKRPGQGRTRAPIAMVVRGRGEEGGRHGWWAVGAQGGRRLDCERRKKRMRTGGGGGRVARRKVSE